ncbi:hypothetical protein CsatB_026897 [Cannabis sativa]|uniref:Uncharacterized protein n=1 Tax=Cannabis sativa TaxID=3483 RepID=A0A7J6DYF7_CANSA|nr:uncharacterized protein LOC115722873 [Cannabis sativa]KAF4351193.1 hypothetical protein F8388_001076 [Cannabis sativa]KAF4377455.1 hypothetical protein G4B88_020969 [Cannabis sativa]
MEEKSNGGGVYVEINSNKRECSNDTLYTVLSRMISFILFPDADSATPLPLLQRIKTSLAENAPLLPDASKNTARHILLWTRRGSPLRALLVISVGTITLLALTGLLLFMVFFLVATFNAIVISLLISLAAAGGFLALFLAGVTAIYIGALSIAVFVISATAISTTIAILIATGWLGFFCTVWLATKKSLGLAKHSLNVTGSALSAYSSSRQARQHPVEDKGSE